MVIFDSTLPLFMSPEPEEPKSWTKLTSNLLQVV